MKRINAIIFFPNGNVAVFDDNGEQIPKLQGSYVRKLIKKAIKLGYDIDGDTEIKLPNGGKARYLKKHDNYEII